MISKKGPWRFRDQKGFRSHQNTWFFGQKGAVLLMGYSQVIRTAFLSGCLSKTTINISCHEGLLWTAVNSCLLPALIKVSPFEGQKVFGASTGDFQTLLPSRHAPQSIFLFSNLGPQYIHSCWLYCFFFLRCVHLWQWGRPFSSSWNSWQYSQKVVDPVSKADLQAGQDSLLPIYCHFLLLCYSSQEQHHEGLALYSWWINPNGGGVCWKSNSGGFL